MGIRSQTREVRVAWILAGLWVASGVCQTALNNDAIVKMVKAGLGEEVVVTTIKGQPGQYATSPDDLIALKAAGVPDKVISAMLARASGETAPKVEAPLMKDGVQLPDELGIYRLKDGKYVSVPPEILNLRTARAAAVFTSGIKAAKINGWIANQHSATHIGPETELLVKIPEGTDPAEYVGLKLEVKRDRREVELARGRINISVSTTRASVPFQSEKLAKGVYKLKFGVFKEGEYGLLPPGANISSNAASAGKIYTFMVE